MRKVFRIPVSFMFLQVVVSAAYADVVVSNLDQPLDFEATADGTHYAAAESFTTAGGTYLLDSVTVAAFSNNTGTSELRLYSDSGGLPGKLIESLGFQTVTNAPDGPPPVTYDSLAPVILQATTTYWLVLGANGTGDFSWNGTLSESEPSPVGWTIGDQALTLPLGGISFAPIWEPLSFGPSNESLQFAISASSVPEPSSFVLGLIALGSVLALCQAKSRRDALRV